MTVHKSYRHSSLGTHALVGGRQGERKLPRKGTVLGYGWGHDFPKHRVPGEPTQTEGRQGGQGRFAGGGDVSAETRSMWRTRPGEFPMGSMSEACGPGGEYVSGDGGWATLDPRELEGEQEMVTGEADRARSRGAWATTLGTQDFVLKAVGSHGRSLSRVGT